MDKFVLSVRRALEQGNLYTALATTLTLPDMCVTIEHGRTSGKQYAAWFDRWVTPLYTHRIGPDRTEHVFLRGGDAYALRCAFLHNGSDDISSQRAREALDGFQFVAPVPGRRIHCNQFDDKLQLQVDIFCMDVCGAVERWQKEAAAAIAAATPLMTIQGA